MAKPKLFISYSWTSPDHEEWVLQLATELRESGVDVILDKWDLKEGHDANVFMEQMVTDEQIKKVLLICDQTYVEKANRRTGGVGTEAQIISGEIYEKSDQEKFVAIVRERNPDGSASLPAYYKSRIYIDLSDPSTYSDNFDQLLRWIFDKPLHLKPELGSMPAFLEENEPTVSLATASRFKRAIDAVRSNKDYADGALRDYFDCLVSEIEKLRLESGASDFDDAVVKSIDGFLPYRNQAIELFEALAQYRDGESSRKQLHRFFELLIPYMEHPPEAKSYREWDFDNFRFIVHELFLYCVAVLVRHERFTSADYLMRNEYYLPGRSEYGRDVMVSFEIFRKYMKSLDHRNQRLKLGRLSVRADMLKQRCKGIGVPFRDLMQADFILFMREHLDNSKGEWHWWPETLLFTSLGSGPFEIFARSRASSYFTEAKVLLGIENKDALVPLLQAFNTGQRRLPIWEYDSFRPDVLLGFDRLGEKP